MADQAPLELCFLAIDHWSTCMTKSEWSGWVQGVGTIVAIAGAAAMAYLQIRRTEKLEHDRLHRSRLSFGMRLIAVKVLFEQADEGLRAPERRKRYLATRYQPDDFERALKDLDEVMAAMVDDPLVRVVGAPSRYMLAKLIEMLGVLKRNLEGNANLDAACEHVLDAIDQFKEEARGFEAVFDRRSR